MGPLKDISGPPEHFEKYFQVQKLPYANKHAGRQHCFKDNFTKGDCHAQRNNSSWISLPDIIFELIFRVFVMLFYII